MSLESLFIKLTSISSLTFAFYVGIFMFISLNSFLFLQHKQKILTVYQGNVKVMLFTAFLFGTSNIFFISAIKTTTVANVVLILAAAPIFAAIFAYLFYKEKSGKNIYVASFFIVIGLLFIVGAQIGAGDFLGNIYALVCASFFSCAFVILSKHPKLNRFAIAAIAGIFSMIGSSLFVQNLQIDMSTLLILLLMGMFISPVSRVLMGIGTKTLPGSEVSLLMIIETVMAPIWVWIFLKEVPASNTFIGGAIILVTLLINSIYLLKRPITR